MIGEEGRLRPKSIDSWIGHLIKVTQKDNSRRETCIGVQPIWVS